MKCRDCQSFSPSVDPSRPRGGLEGYGYCSAAPTVELRSKFFPELINCWQATPLFQAKRP